MKLIKLVAIVCLLTLRVCCVAQERTVGANLTDTSPFGTQWYYTNALKQSTSWLIRNANDSGDPMNFSSELRHELDDLFDADGYPLQVPFDFSNNDLTNGKTLDVNCLVLNGQPAPYFYPSGTYLLVFEGSGTIAIQGDVDGEYMEFNTAGSHDVSISNPSGVGLELIILESLMSNPITNVQLIFPDYTESYTDQKYQDEFIEFASEFEVLRFMKPIKSENNTIQDWDDRTTESEFSYFLDLEDEILLGMPYEDVIRLSNAAGIDPWITIPYRATDEYIQQLASLFNDELDEGRNLYIEYSNETWNPAYPQTRAYMLEMGQSLATSEIGEVVEFEAIHRFHSKRSIEMFELFEGQFDDDSRLVKVLGTQSDPYTADLVFESFELASVNPNNRRPDAVAIAAYIGVTLFDDLREQDIEICGHSPEELLDTLRNRIVPELREMTTRYSELAQANSIELFAYEGGQHVTELNFQPMDPCAAELVAQMNRLTEMEDFFCELFDEWYDTYNGGVLNVFNLVEGPDDFGSFGILESQWQNTSDSPKWQGIEDCGLSYDEIESPTDVSLSSTSIEENNTINQIVGIFTSTDPNPQETFTYSLVSGDGSDDHASFSIDGDQLVAAQVFDFENKESYNIRVQTTNSAGGSYQESFTITIQDVNELVSGLSDESTDNLRIFPNPARDYVSLDLDKNSSWNVSVYSATGKKIQEHSTTNSYFKIDSRKWEKGMYFLHISNGANTYIRKVLIERR